MQNSDLFLTNHWYFALCSAEVNAKALVSRKLFNEKILFFRDSSGQVTALRDICPHRGIPLSYGQKVNGEVECPYHGWRFNAQGVCTLIPSITESQDLNCQKIKIKKFPVQEFQGMVWIFLKDDSLEDVPDGPQPPRILELSAGIQPNIQRRVEFNCHMDHAIIGLMDPAHGPYVHKSWFWRSSRTMYTKQKKFAPLPFGFKMVRHAPSKNSKAYKILGGAPTTEISFSLPGVRVEHVKVGARHFFSYTLLTPIDANKTQVYQLAYWDLPILFFLKPFVKYFVDLFLGQDRLAVNRQQEGLVFQPTLMLIKDADTQAKWYYTLKKEWQEAQQQKRNFKNPIQETTLQWRS